MPRLGGESEKLGARFEGVWTVDSILDLIVGRATTLTVEPLHDSEGIEFVLTASGGMSFFHSVKRQTTDREWSLSALTRPTGQQVAKNILGDLIAKVRASRNHHAVFVSSTGANTLREVTERAWRSLDSDLFQENIASSGDLLRQYRTYILPLFDKDHKEAFDGLRHLRVVLINEAELIRRVEDRIESILVPASDIAQWPTAARLHIAELVLNRLGQPLDAESVWAFLETVDLRRKPLTVSEHQISAAEPPSLRKSLPLEAPRNATTIIGEFDRLLYTTRAIKFVGRRQELNDLHEFANDRRDFLWWLWTGPGGVGKSRIALEFCDAISEQWETGFLPYVSDFPHWGEWHPQRPAFIVVDYCSTRARSCGALVRRSPKET